MAQNPVSVTTPGMQQAAGHFQTAIGASAGTLSGTRAQVSTLGVAWTGEASGLFGRSLNAWCAEYENIINQLRTMHEALTGNAKVYVQTEASNTELARNPMTGLQGL